LYSSASGTGPSISAEKPPESRTNASCPSRDSDQLRNNRAALTFTAVFGMPAPYDVNGTPSGGTSHAIGAPSFILGIT
jgi:hypothetical protein